MVEKNSLPECFSEAATGPQRAKPIPGPLKGNDLCHLFKFRDVFWMNMDNS